MKISRLVVWSYLFVHSYIWASFLERTCFRNSGLVPCQSASKERRFIACLVVFGLPESLGKGKPPRWCEILTDRFRDTGDIRALFALWSDKLLCTRVLLGIGKEPPSLARRASKIGWSPRDCFVRDIFVALVGIKSGDLVLNRFIGDTGECFWNSPKSSVTIDRFVPRSARSLKSANIFKGIWGEFKVVGPNKLCPKREE